jgi:hypothetical protein
MLNSSNAAGLKKRIKMGFTALATVARNRSYTSLFLMVTLLQ